MEGKSQSNSDKNISFSPASERLKSLKEEVMEKWKERVCHEIPAAKVQTNSQIRNSIPKFLDKLSDALSEDSFHSMSLEEVNETSQDHGEQRAGLKGYSLVQMLREYQILREVIFSTLERHSPITNPERDVILASIEQGMAEASAHFELISFREGKASRIVLDVIRDHAIIRTDENGNIIDWNFGAEKLFGWKKEEVLGKYGGMIFTPEDLEKKADKEEKVIAAREGKAEDKRWHVRKDGNRFFANGIMNSLYDNEKNIFGFIKVLRDDTDRAKNEEDKRYARKALEVERENIQRLFDLSPGYVAIWQGSDFVYTYTNPAHDKIHGRHVTGEKLLEAVPNLKGSDFLNLLNNVVKTGNPETIKEVPFHVAGQIKYFTAIYVPWKNEKGENDGVISWGNDVTEQVLATKEIKESEHKFRTLMDTVPHMVWSIDTNGAFKFISSQFSNYTGLKNQNIDGRIWEKIIHPEDLNTINEAIQKATDAQASLNFQHRILRTDGAYRWNLAQSNPVFDDGGKLIGWIGTTTDIHDQKMVEEALKISEARFKQIANAVPHIVWTARPDGTIDWQSDKFLEYTGLSTDTKFNSKEGPMHPDDIGPTERRLSHSVIKGEIFEIEHRIRKKSDGEYRWNLSKGIPVKNEEGNIILWIGSTTDIHDHKILVQKLEEEKELRERFVAALSHDLRTPLTSAKLTAQVTRKSYIHDDKITRSSDRIISNLDRVDNMIQDLLDVSQLSAGESLPLVCQECDLSIVVHSTVEELRHIHGNRFEIVEESNNVKGSWDSGGIRRIIENLCNNAVKYGDPKQPIKICIGCTSKEMAVMSVHNYGMVISPKEKVLLFEPFRRASDAVASGKKGWGIGLMLVKGVVDAHCGSIEVTSSEIEGTTFTVKLPVRSSSCS